MSSVSKRTTLLPAAFFAAVAVCVMAPLLTQRTVWPTVTSTSRWAVSPALMYFDLVSSLGGTILITIGGAVALAASSPSHTATAALTSREIGRASCRERG